MMMRICLWDNPGRVFQVEVHLAREPIDRLDGASNRLECGDNSLVENLRCNKRRCHCSTDFGRPGRSRM